MSDLHREVNFENEICEHLAAHGRLTAQDDAAGYDSSTRLVGLCFPFHALQGKPDLLSAAVTGKIDVRRLVLSDLQ